MKKPSDKDMQELVNIVGSWVGLNGISIEYDEWKGDNMGNIKCTVIPAYSTLKIDIDFDSFKDSDIFCKAIMHECCHYYTGAASSLIGKDSYLTVFLEDNLGFTKLVMVCNAMCIVEEQATTRLEELFWSGFILTPDYKKYKKLFSKYF